ncbi:hypothetical protein B7463_g6118, partial [Scytalidium lignicola]
MSSTTSATTTPSPTVAAVAATAAAHEVSIENETALRAAAATTVGPQTQKHKQKPKAGRICRYFGSAGYCRNGNDCPFVHDQTMLPGSKLGKDEAIQSAGINSEASTQQPVLDENVMVQDRRQAVRRPPAARVVPKPVPKAQVEDPREFQLGQIRRRYSPKETNQSANELWGIEEGTTSLKFNLPPSDPDFPFEISVLECQLSVPPGYPESRPTLKVGNRDIPRGFAVNVERGFDNLAQEKKNASLLELIKALDKNLETFLSVQKAETVTIVPNKDTRHLSTAPLKALNAVTSASTLQDAAEVAQEQPKEEGKPVELIEAFSQTQIAEAAKKREAETRQLEARMGRLPFYQKSSDGIAYTLPITPARPQDLPISPRVVKSTKLFVPLLYPLQSVRIKLEGVDEDHAKIVEKAFEQKAKEQKHLNLMGHVNFLSSKMHILATTVLEPEDTTPLPTPSQLQPDTKSSPASKESAIGGEADPGKSHIHHIPRPPEWVMVNPDDGSGDESADSYTYDSGDESTEGGVEVPPEDKDKSEPSSSGLAPANPERGTALSFPFLELYGIELLEVATLNLSVKCERCKEVIDIKGLKNGVVKNESLPLFLPVLGVLPPIQLQESSPSAAKQPAMSAGNVTNASHSSSPTSSSSASAHPIYLPPQVPAARRRPLDLPQARNSPNVVAVDTTPSPTAGSASAAARRCTPVIGVTMKAKNTCMSGLIA